MRDSRYRETWEESADGQILGALINGDLGWLMYLRQSGDAGFSSRNPSYAGPPDAVIEYYLGNGQRDEYPATWALPVIDVMHALKYFREHNAPPPFVTWHNDSGDGASIGVAA
jgi:hypothetical protein